MPRLQQLRIAWLIDEGAVCDPRSCDRPIGASAMTLQRSDQEWLVEELLRRRPSDEIIDGLDARGYPRPIAEQSMAELATNPIFISAFRVQKAGRKLSGLMRAMGELFVHSAFELRRLEVSSAEFYSEFFFTNRPVILQGLMREWPAVEKWRPEYFKSRYGEVVVEVMVGRDGDRDYELNHANHYAEVKLSHFIDLITRTESANDCYLVARNHVLDLPGMETLRADFDCPVGFLDPDTGENPFVRLWLGPAGTLTQLHCDDCNILFGQITGRKQVRLIPPYFYQSLYNVAEYCSAVDLDDIDLTKFPAMRDVPVLEAVLEPGEFLFIPIGWWHWVKALELSSSLTFTNFYHDQPPVMWPELLE